MRGAHSAFGRRICCATEDECELYSQLSFNAKDAYKQLQTLMKYVSMVPYSGSRTAAGREPVW